MCDCCCARLLLAKGTRREGEGEGEGGDAESIPIINNMQLFPLAAAPLLSRLPRDNVNNQNDKDAQTPWHSRDRWKARRGFGWDEVRLIGRTHVIFLESNAISASSSFNQSRPPFFGSPELNPKIKIGNSNRQRAVGRGGLRYDRLVML